MSGAWAVLALAGVFEVCWAIGLKHTEGFTRPVPSALTIGAMAISVWLLARALEHLPVGTAYAVWTGIGAVGVAITGALLFDEPVTVARVASIAAIVAGIAGLKLAS